MSESFQGNESVNQPSSPEARWRASQRKQIASIAAHERWARSDTRAGTAKARETQWENFLKEVDPNGLLSEEERTVRALHLRTARMKALALKSAQARRKRSPLVE